MHDIPKSTSQRLTDYPAFTFNRVGGRVLFAKKQPLAP
jgi:hypothetical protein